MHPDTLTKWFTKFIKNNNMPYITLHGLRHTSLTLLIASGLDIKTICDFSGHAQASTLIEIYGHALKKRKVLPVETLQNLLIE